MKNDIEIQQDVISELEQDQNVPSGSVGVEVHHGVVKLAGASNDPAIKENAARDASKVEGVTKVVLDMGIERR